jgi:FMNH2-dependent dimethyl sulfone monooxygenase
MNSRGSRVDAYKTEAPLKFGLYAPIPMATVGSLEIAQSAAAALEPLPDGRRDVQYEYGSDLLLAADAVGFDLCLFAERHLGHDLAAWVLASAIASRFEHMRALVAVHPGLVDPVMIAKLAASLDRICKGRMAVNIVNGWFDEEFRMFGGTVLQGEGRYKRAVEFIDILRGLWTQESFSLHGDHYTVDNGRLLLKPASPIPPEMYSVSSGDQGRDFIAENCDWWFVNYPKTAQTTDEVMRGLEEAIADMELRTARLGRKVRYALNPFVAIGDDERTALDAVLKRIFDCEPDPDPRKIESRMLPVTKAGLIGSPDAVITQLRRFESMGFELILCKMIPTVENIQAIAREVIEPMRQGSHQSLKNTPADGALKHVGAH